MEGFRRKLCAVTPLWRISLMLELILAFITLFSLAFLEPGTESFYISLVNLAVLSALLAVNIAILYACEGRTETKELEHVESTDVPDDG